MSDKNPHFSHLASIFVICFLPQEQLQGYLLGEHEDSTSAAAQWIGEAKASKVLGDTIDQQQTHRGLSDDSN